MKNLLIIVCFLPLVLFSQPPATSKNYFVGTWRTCTHFNPTKDETCADAFDKWYFKSDGSYKLQNPAYMGGKAVDYAGSWNVKPGYLLTKGNSPGIQKDTVYMQIKIVSDSCFYWLGIDGGRKVYNYFIKEK